MTDLTEMTVTLPAYATDRVEAKLAKLAKKAGKLGVTAPTVEFTNFREREIRSDVTGLRTGEFEVVCDATLRYEEIKVSGDWTLLASVEKEELGNVVYSASGKDFTHLREATLNCDHCHHRRARKIHYVVGNAAGEEKVVGSTCMKDFLGINPTKALNYFVAIRDFMDDEEFRSGGAGKRWVNIETLAAWTVREVELSGRFISRGAAYESYGELTSTADAVNCNFAMQDNSFAKLEDRERVKPTEKNIETARLVMAHLNKSLETVERVGVERASEWDYKIANFLKRGFTGMYGKDFNIIVGAVGAALRKIDSEREETLNAVEAFGAEYVDTVKNSKVKDRITVEGKVITVRECESNFGYYASTNTMIIVRCGHGKDSVRVRFFTSKAPFDQWNEGDKVKFSAKVKRHNDDPKWGYSVDMNYPKEL